MPKVLEKKVLREGYGADGLSIVLVEHSNGYGVYYYSHCEDRHYPVMTTTDIMEAKDHYYIEIYRHAAKNAILRVAQKRVERGAQIEDIQRLQEQLLDTWKDPDIREFVQNLDKAVFAE